MAYGGYAITRRRSSRKNNPMTITQGLTYAKAGVSIAAGDKLVRRIAPIAVLARCRVSHGGWHDDLNHGLTRARNQQKGGIICVIIE